MRDLPVWAECRVEFMTSDPQAPSGKRRYPEDTSPWSTTPMIAGHRTSSKLSVTIVATLMMALTLLIGTAGSASAASTDENGFVSLTNSYRTQNGLPELQYDAALSDIARSWAQQMAGS